MKKIFTLMLAIVASVGIMFAESVDLLGMEKDYIFLL